MGGHKARPYKFMKTKIIILFILFFSFYPTALLSVETTLQEKFQQGNEAYFARDFPKAIQIYGELERRGLKSGDLFYNLGNTYYRMGQVGRAVYYYAKALRYHPRDRDLNANYRYVLSQRADKIEEPLSQRATRMLFFLMELTTLKELLMIAALFYVLFFVLLAFNIVRRRFVLTAALWGLAAINLFLLPSAAMKFYQERIRATAVVVKPLVPVLSEPSVGAIKLFELHEGALGSVTDREGDFIKVQLADGKRGWVSRAEVEEI